MAWFMLLPLANFNLHSENIGGNWAHSHRRWSAFGESFSAFTHLFQKTLLSPAASDSDWPVKPGCFLLSSQPGPNEGLRSMLCLKHGHKGSHYKIGFGSLVLDPTLSYDAGSAFGFQLSRGAECLSPSPPDILVRTLLPTDCRNWRCTIRSAPLQWKAVLRRVPRLRRK